MNAQYDFWNSAFSGRAYYYGFEPGPVARRAVRYGEASTNGRSLALDVGCGEGQDLAYLAEQGFEATGLDFTLAGIEKSRTLLEQRGVTAQTRVVDLAECDWAEYAGRFELVIAVNSLQFLGAAAPAALEGVVAAVAPGGILGLSLFAPGGLNEAREDVFLVTQQELWALLNPDATQPRFTPLETVDLQQWHPKLGKPQPFVTVVARRRLPQRPDNGQELIQLDN
jgi:SAM-dependent methyltransferase